MSSSKKLPPKGETPPWTDKVFITQDEPEVALVSWYVRLSRSIPRISEDPGVACDICGENLDWEPFAVIDLPNEEEWQDLEYIPAGGTALCKACAKKFYHLREKDVGKVHRLWLCHEVEKNG